MKPVTLSLLQPSQQGKLLRQRDLYWCVELSQKLVVFLPICLHTYSLSLKSKSNKDAIHLIGEKDRVMIGMQVYIISIEVGGGGSGSGPLLSFIESPKSLLLPLPSPMGQ